MDKKKYKLLIISSPHAIETRTNIDDYQQVINLQSYRLLTSCFFRHSDGSMDVRSGSDMMRCREFERPRRGEYRRCGSDVCR
jgi:hypothetical protein